MKKKILPFIALADGTVCLTSFLLAVRENGSTAAGMAALTSLGRWVLYAGVFLVSMAVFVLLIAVLLLGKRRGKDEVHGHGDGT